MYISLERCDQKDNADHVGVCEMGATHDLSIVQTGTKKKEEKYCLMKMFTCLHVCLQH